MLGNKSYRLMYIGMAIALIIAACTGNGAMHQKSAVVPSPLPTKPPIEVVIDEVSMPTPAPVSTPSLLGMTQVVMTVDSYVSLTTPQNSEYVVEFHNISGGYCYVDVNEDTYATANDAIATVVWEQFYIRCNAGKGYNTVELFVPQTWTVGFPVTR